MVPTKQGLHCNPSSQTQCVAKSTTFVQSAQNQSQLRLMTSPPALSTPLAPTVKRSSLSSKWLLHFSQQKLRTRKCAQLVCCLSCRKTPTHCPSHIWYWTPQRSQSTSCADNYRSPTTSHPAPTGALQGHSMYWYPYHRYWKCHQRPSKKHTDDLHNC